MIVIVDYGMGNLRSIQKAFQSLGKRTVVSANYKILLKASWIVLPGVGSFGKAVKNLKSLDLWNPLRETILYKKKPFLGICLGLQLMFERSQEDLQQKGMGLFKGKILRFQGIITPHMGWNRVWVVRNSPLFKGIGKQAFFYFCHSYYAPLGEFTLGYTLYGTRFSACIQDENMILVQFHPEKSQRLGLRFLNNFLNL